MKKNLIIYLSFLFLIIFFEKSFSQQLSVGEVVSGKIKLTNSIRFELPKGDWEIVRKSSDIDYGISQRIIGLVQIQNNEIFQAIEIYEGLLGGMYQSAIDTAINEIVFKNRYDGCYERPEYNKLELYRKGSTHNCMYIEPWDLPKELNNPDDPELRGMGAAYNYWIKEYNYKVPKIVLTSNHSYFSRLVGGNWYRVTYIFNPKIFDAPNSSFQTVETSEFHPGNIDNFVEYKKVMEKFLDLSVERHKSFEKLFKTKKNHKLRFQK